jgi:DNA-binding transcriptional MerR regulator
MKPGDAAKILNLGRSTISAWTSDPDFREFFTPNAQGGSGRPRNISEHDLRLLAYIDEAKHNNMPMDEILLELRQMRADDWEGLPNIPEAPIGTANVPVMPLAAAEATLSAERKSLLREIAYLQDRIDELNDDIDKLQEEHKAEKTELLLENSRLLQKMTQFETELQIYRQTAMSAVEAQEITRKLAEAELSVRFYQEGRIRENDDGRDDLLRRLYEVETELRFYKEGRLRPPE